DLEGVVVLVAFHISLARREAAFAATGRHGIEVAKEEDRDVSKLSHLIGDASRLARAILWTVRMQVCVADVDYIALKDERRYREAARRKKEDLSRKRIVHSMTVEHLELAEKQVLVLVCGEADSVGDRGAKAADDSIVIPLAELSGYAVAKSERAVEYLLQPNNIKALATLINPIGNQVRVCARVVEQFDPLCLFGRYL